MSETPRTDAIYRDDWPALRTLAMELEVALAAAQSDLARLAQSNAELAAEVERLRELLWSLYEGIYGHRAAEGIDPFKSAVGGALELKKAWYERGYPAERELAAQAKELERDRDQAIEYAQNHQQRAMELEKDVLRYRACFGEWQDTAPAQPEVLERNAERLNAIESGYVIVRRAGRDNTAWEARRGSSSHWNADSWHVATTLRAAIDAAIDKERGNE